MGTERREARGTGQPTTGAAPQNRSSPQQGVISGTVGVSAHPGRARGGRSCAAATGQGGKAIADAELEQLRSKEWRTYEQYNAEFRKQERYCKEQREVLRALGDLKEQERNMYELDNRKDQVMTVCKVALANLAMWVRDWYFPASYAQAIWKRLLPFFQLPGTITQNATMVQVELHPFNDRALNRDLAILCERVNQASPRLPDGRQLSFTTRSSC
jgi:hypothetical protein